MIDSHSHLNDKILFFRAKEIINKAKEFGIKSIIVPGYDLESSKKAIFLSNKYNMIYGAVGIHPNNCFSYNKNLEKELICIAKKFPIVAIGEIGLDYHYENFNKKNQQNIFIKQLEIARILKKPVIIHSRDATEDTLNILLKYAKGLKGVIHCFSSSKEIAFKYIIKLGFYISFSGIITFKNSFSIKNVIKQIPLEYLLIETDAPYMTPYPYRKLINEPKYLYYTLKMLSEIKKKDIKNIEHLTEQNTINLFDL